MSYFDNFDNPFPRSQPAQLRREAETVVATAKARLERMILGEEMP